MNAFWILAACMLAGALLLVLPPLLRRDVRSRGGARDAMTLAVHRDQLAELEADLAAGTISREDYEAARAEIERRVLEELPAAAHAEARPARIGPVAAVVGLALPVLVVVVYLQVGNPGALGVSGRGPAPPEAAHDVTPEQVAAMVEQLARHMQENPGELEGWVVLARSYGALGRFEESAGAYAKATELAPDDPQLLVDYADALAMAQGRDLSGRPAELVRRALELDPNHPKALALAGTIAFNAQDFRGAAEHWERLRTQLQPGSEAERSVVQSIAEARSRGGLAESAAPEAPAAPAAATLSGSVSIAPALASRVGPGDTLFIFARAAEGPRMPLAVLRQPAQGLPAQFTLDESTAMSPQLRLSQFPRLVVAARISRSGNATAQSGDLEGVSEPVAPGATGIAVTIDRVIP